MSYLSIQGYDTSHYHQPVAFDVEGVIVLGAQGQKNDSEGHTEQLLIFFVDSEENLISYNTNDLGFITEGVSTEIDFGVAVHEYRDVYVDCHPLETTAAAITQYLSGMSAEEF